MADYQLITLSVPTSGGGVTAAATYGFFTEGYRIPRQERSTTSDFVHNQNGRFIYRYDNGPGSFIFEPFRIVLSDRLAPAVYPIGATAQEQWERLQFLWQYIGNIGLEAPEGVYEVNWSGAPLERAPLGFPAQAGDKIDYKVNVSFEEGG